MSSAKLVLRSIDRARKELDKLSRERYQRVEQHRKRLEKADERKAKELASTIADLEVRLASFNRFRVGDIIQRTAPDGLPSTQRYQVTRVKDHESFWARLLTARGKMGATVEFFKKGRYADPNDYKKVDNAPLQSAGPKARRRSK